MDTESTKVILLATSCRGYFADAMSCLANGEATDMLKRARDGNWCQGNVTSGVPSIVRFTGRTSSSLT